MSGLEVLGAACAIFQTVSFAHEVFTLCYGFYDNKPVAFDRLKEYADGMEGAMSSIKDYAETLQRSQPSDEKELISVLQNAEETAAQLRIEVAYVLEKRRSGSILRAVRTHIRHTKRKSVILSLKANLEDCDRVVKLILSKRDVQSLDAVSFQMSTGFAGLSDQIKTFIQELVQRQIEAGEAAEENQRVLRADLVDLSGHVSQSHLDTRTYIDRRISDRDQLEKDRQAHQQLLNSLYFPEIWQRQNMIDLNEASFEEAFVLRDVLMQQQDISNSASTDEHTESVSNLGIPETNRVHEAVASLRNWIETGDTLFWISGHAGSGKSTLVKYLAEQEREHSQRNPDLSKEVLTHYFWKAGSSKKQRNKFGCFCSLVYQMLLHDEDRYGKLLQLNPKLGQKKTTADWSEPELQHAFSHLIKGSSNTFIFFIDGLDETGDDQELFPVLDMLDLQSQMPNTRFCVSSRPEFILEQHLSRSPTVTVQDLTHQSMKRYSERKLGPALDQKKGMWDPLDIIRLYSEVTYKADGIFLWLVLVTDILRRSILQGEDYPNIRKRLDRMPTKLEPLFTKMWERMGDDFVSYQKLAASYINIVILHRQLEEALHQDGVFIGLGTYLALSVVLFAAHLETSEHLFEPGSNADLRGLVAWLEARRHDIATYCMGLLVCTHRKTFETNKNASLDSATESLLRTVGEAFSQGVSFVHRSAFDYFTNTVQGKNICSKSNLPYAAGCRAMARAYGLGLCLLAEFRSKVPHLKRAGFTALEHTEYAINALAQAVRCSDDGSLTHILEIFEMCARACGSLTFASFFHTKAAQHTSMVDVLARESSISAGLATRILRHYWKIYSSFEWRTDSKITRPLVLAQRMIEAGANPLEVIPGEGSDSMTCKSAFDEFMWQAWNFLADSVYVKDQRRRRIIIENWYRPDGILAAWKMLLRTNPRLDSTALLMIESIKNGPLHLGPYDASRMAVFGNLDISTHPPSEVTGLFLVVDNLWLCEQIMTILSRSQFLALEEGQSSSPLLTDIQKIVARLQENQGARKPAPSVARVFKRAASSDTLFWRTMFVEMSATAAVTAFLDKLYFELDYRKDEGSEDFEGLVEVLMRTDDPGAYFVEGENGGKKPAELPCAETHEWSQRPDNVHSMTWNEAQRYAGGNEPPGLPFLVEEDAEGCIWLRMRETLSQDHSVL